MDRRRLHLTGRLLTALGLVLLPSAAHGQTVRGVLRDATTGETVPSALVRLETPAGQAVESSLTDSDGRFLIRPAAPGRYRLVVRHIGHATVTTDDFDLTVDATQVLELEAGLSPVRLRGVTANEDRRCRTLDEEDAVVVAGFWDEARKALEAAQWTLDRGGLTYEVDHFFRDLDPGDLRVVEEQIRTRTGEGANPFKSLPAEQLADSGYVRGNDVDGRDYFAPDANVLLSSTFMNSHCFRMGDSPAGGPVRLEFEPVGDRDVPDIRGALELNGESLKLRRLEFGYTNLDLGVETDALGGYVDFEELVTGAWIVRNWAIRMPRIYAYRLRSRRLHKDLVGIREVGGLVQAVHDMDGQDVRAPDGLPRPR